MRYVWPTPCLLPLQAFNFPFLQFVDCNFQTFVHWFGFGLSTNAVDCIISTTTRLILKKVREFDYFIIKIAEKYYWNEGGKFWWYEIIFWISLTYNISYQLIGNKMKIGPYIYWIYIFIVLSDKPHEPLLVYSIYIMGFSWNMNLHMAATYKFSFFMRMISFSRL